MVHLPDGANIGIAPIWGEDFSVDVVTRTENSFRYAAEGVAGTLLPQSFRKRFPLFSGESKSLKEAGLAATVGMLGVQKLVDDLFLFDPGVGSVGEVQCDRARTEVTLPQADG